MALIGPYVVKTFRLFGSTIKTFFLVLPFDVIIKKIDF